MSKRQATVSLDENLLRTAECTARDRHTTLDELIEQALRREMRPTEHHRARPVKLPTHGRGGLLPGVNLEDKELMDRLLNEA